MGLKVVVFEEKGRQKRKQFLLSFPKKPACFCFFPAYISENAFSMPFSSSILQKNKLKSVLFFVDKSLLE